VFAALLALISAHSLATETFRVPAHDYRYIPAHIANWPATLISDSEVSSGAAVTLELLTKQALAEFVRGGSPAFVLKMNNSRKLDFRQTLPERGDYEIVLINDSDRPSDIAFDAAVEFPREPDVARYVSPGRKLAVISISLLVFVVSVAWSGFKLMGVMRRS